MLAEDFGIPDSYLRPGRRLIRLHDGPGREWSIEDAASGGNIGTLIATEQDLGEPEWYVVSDERPEPEAYWPSWRLALKDFLETVD